MLRELLLKTSRNGYIISGSEMIHPYFTFTLITFPIIIDREHPHVHIVFNRIDNNGKTISDRNDMYRNEQVCKKLKAKQGPLSSGASATAWT